jgi:predicted transcriptional regulator of viral defense system
MVFARLLAIVGSEPAFQTGLLLAGAVDANDVRRQLSRWVNAGRLYQLRRGLYTLAPPFQKAKPHPFVLANHMVRGSYVSCQSALAHYGLIPEYVPVTTSVTVGRPARWQTPLGAYEYHHIKTALLYGYRWMDLGGEQQGLLATPEKALLDLIHLQPGGDTPDYLRELRLQGLERLNLDELARQAALAFSPKLRRAATLVTQLARDQAQEYVTL